MPNTPINPQIAQALTNAFGGSSSAPVQQPSAPSAPPSGGSAGGPSLWQALLSYIKPQSPFDPNSGQGSPLRGKDSE